MCKKQDNLHTVSAVRSSHETNPPRKRMRVLVCSENVPPQVNGIARRVGHYVDGLSRLECDVDLLSPDSKGVWSHPNPWNFTAAMMCIFPGYFLRLMNETYDVVHVVMPMNFSGLWLLIGYKLLRLFTRSQKPALVISWHCNLFEYTEHHFPKALGRFLKWIFFDVFMSILPEISDRILTPTMATENVLTRKWNENGLRRTGVCYTGVDKCHFHPRNKYSESGKIWQARKERFLQETNNTHLLVCVSRLSPEKGVDELINCMPMLKGCALWLVGDGPDRLKYEALAEELKISVRFLGYQKGESLHSVYTMADVFVCPSTTETFGQTVNEAIASEVRVALPTVKVFAEAFGEHIPIDAFWEPLNRQSMVTAIKLQLKRHDEDSGIGKPDANKLRSWEDASAELRKEYELAEHVARSQQNETRLRKRTMVILPLWILCTIVAANYVYMLSLIRTALGGMSLRYFIETTFLCRRVIARVIHSKESTEV
jgi:glycosyltransferase involved in cell wall biosynthesis